MDPDAPWPPKLIQKTPGAPSALEKFHHELAAADERAFFGADPYPTRTVADALLRLRTALAGSHKQRVFVVWDFTIIGLDLMLTSLKSGPPAGFEIDVPGLEGQGGGSGELLHDVLLPGIENSDKVLVVTDRPNANVAFEAGLAVGFGKPIALVCFRAEIPAWLKESAFKGYLVKTVSEIGELRRLIEQEWKRPQASDLAPGHGETLFLCPSQYVGAALREEQKSILEERWRVPGFQINLNYVQREFSRVAQIVWTIASFGEGGDVRDGAENAANGLVAGWFYARAFRSFGKEAEQRLTVIRQENAREVLDVAVVAKSFKRVSEFVWHLKDVKDYRLPEPQLLETVRRGAINYKMKKVPPPNGRQQDIWVGAYPVMNYDDQEFRSATRHPEPEHWKDLTVDDAQPVVGVSVDDADKFCEWAELELPDLDLWLHCARAGSGVRYWWGDTDKDKVLSEVAWHSENSDGRLHRVGEKKANTWGLHDVLGNIWEWTKPHETIKENPITGDEYRVKEVRVLGGSFATPPTDLDSPKINPATTDLMTGFRCVKIYV